MITNQQNDVFEGPQPNNQVWYTSIDEKFVQPMTYIQGPKVVSNVYENGKGVITFDGELQGGITFYSEDIISISFPQTYVFSHYVQSEAILFFPCPHLKRIKYAGGDGINLIWDGVLINVANHNLKEYEIPSNLVVRRDAFIGRPDSLETIEIGEGTTLMEGALSGLKALKKIIGEKSTRSYKCWYEGDTLIAFACGCEDTDCDIKEGTKKIGREVFIDSKLKTIKLPKTLKEIGWRAFDGLNNVVMRGKNVTSDGQFLIVDNEVILHFYNRELGLFHKMTIPDDVKGFNIHDKALFDCTYEFPETLESLHVEFKSYTKLVFRGKTPPIMEISINAKLLKNWEKYKRDRARFREEGITVDNLLQYDHLPIKSINIIVPSESISTYKDTLRHYLEMHEDLISISPSEDIN